MTADDPRHGTLNGYTNLHCRCDPCREANAVAHYEYMHRRPDQRAKHRNRARRQRVVQQRNKESGGLTGMV